MSLLGAHCELEKELQGAEMFAMEKKMELAISKQTVLESFTEIRKQLQGDKS
jgi:hypothetical protein